MKAHDASGFIQSLDECILTGNIRKKIHAREWTSTWPALSRSGGERKLRRAISPVTANGFKSGEPPSAFNMSRALIVIGLLTLMAGLLWPWLRRVGLGRLPGDIVIQRGNFSFSFPIMTCLLISVALSALFWLINR